MTIGLAARALGASALTVSAGHAAPHYSVQLHVEPGSGSIHANTRIEMGARETGAGKSFLLSRNYKVAGLASSANATASVENADKPFPGIQRIDVKPKPGAKGLIWVTVDYSGKLFQSEETPVNIVEPRRLELSADSLWYPISTNFNERFTYDATITGLPTGLNIVAPERVSAGKGAVRLHRTSPSQDIAFSGATGLQRRSIGHLTIAALDFSHPRTQAYLHNAPKALQFMEGWFGPLPTGKAIISVVTRRNGSGYSRPGYLVVADNGESFKPDDVWGPVGYVAHELSHSWWSSGDFTSEDYWLVEGPADYTAFRFIESQKGRAALQPLIANKVARAAKAGPILGLGRPNRDAVYGKAPILLMELEQEIGRAKFDPMFGRLARRRTLTTADFLDELRRTAGADVARRFEAKLRS